MTLFNQLPWWGQVVFVLTNLWIIFIAGLLIRQAVRAGHLHLPDSITKKRTESANEERREYGRSHSGYIDA
jgi:hypothetical protein